MSAEEHISRNQYLCVPAHIFALVPDLHISLLGRSVGHRPAALQIHKREHKRERQRKMGLNRSNGSGRESDTEKVSKKKKKEKELALG